MLSRHVHGPAELVSLAIDLASAYAMLAAAMSMTAAIAMARTFLA
jgi:hypothetical protein